jgi:Uma2 family endonuclease
MATALNARHQTLEDFLAWERAQPDRYERVSGVVRMMTGGTIDHNRITLNVADAFRRRLSGGDYEAFVNDVKVVTPAGDVMYPDVVVACGDIAGKADGTWQSVILRDLRDRLELTALKLEIGLEEVFARVAFPATKSGSASAS